MRRDLLIQRFKEETTGKNYLKGEKVFHNDLVSSIEITDEENLICIDGTVISENLFSEYNVTIEIDATNKSVLSTSCTCKDYEKHEFTSGNYCCKHIVASFYKALDDLLKNPLLNEEEEEKIKFKEDKNILSLLLDEDKDKEELKLEVYINRYQWNDKISAEFKIGIKTMTSSKLYVIKDIDQFLMGYYSKIPIKYGQNFTFNIKKQKFNTKEKRIIDFIELLKTMEGPKRAVYRSESKNIDGKYIKIPKDLLREFFERVKNNRVYLNEGFFYRTVETEIVFDNVPIEFDLKTVKNDYILKMPNGIAEPLSDKEDVFLFGTTIYLPDYDFCYRIAPYIKAFNNSKSVVIPKSEENRILKHLIPQLNLISSNITLSKSIKDKVVIEPVEFKFYFDKERKDITLTTKVKYGKYEFNIFKDINEKIIYRDSKKEKRILSSLRELGFEEINEKFYFIFNDDYIFDFFKNKINILQNLGEVFYSENFKGIKSLGSKGIKGDIKTGNYNYFEMNFKLSDISEEETKDILRSFRDNLKYYKLKSGEFLDLEELELKKFLKLLDVVSPENLENNHIEIDKSKGLFLSNYLEENQIRYIKGKNHLKEIKDKFKNIEKLKFKEPEGLKATLRNYQKSGYNWFKTLDYLGFGGILGDEMGLGKTLQTITFILSNKNCKTLIIAPTSLIYNWNDEFQKFAPTVRVGICNGVKKDRDLIINNVKNYDVIITTYNLIKRDFEEYKNLEFDYCILDEAQYIKNPSSQNAIATKEIKAKKRFALSGTPIENSLMELWSIFDFIMPNYLFDEKRFSVRYYKKLKESPEVLEELNSLVKPFILRRRKKDVIKELPDKIEKKILVSLTEEQKNVYGTYANYAMELIEKKVKDDEFKNSKIEILSYITKLRQIVLDPSVLMEDYTGDSGKIEALIEILSQSIDEGHKILVFSQFTSVLKNISKRLKEEKFSFSYLDGSISSEKRMEIVKDFNEGENSIFLISLKAGGTGLNLTSADIVIHFDPWWNPAVEDQATDRAHRIGQKKVVEVLKLIAKDTIEEKIIDLQNEKKKLISSLMDNDLSKAENLISLTEEDILKLFSID